MEKLVLDKSGSRLWLNMYQVTRNFSILHIQGNLGNSCGNRNQGYREIRNPRLWNPEYSSRNLDLNDDRNLESKFH